MSLNGPSPFWEGPRGPLCLSPAAPESSSFSIHTQVQKLRLLPSSLPLFLISISCDAMAMRMTPLLPGPKCKRLVSTEGTFSLICLSTPILHPSSYLGSQILLLLSIKTATRKLWQESGPKEWAPYFGISGCKWNCIFPKLDYNMVSFQFTCVLLLGCL